VPFGFDVELIQLYAWGLLGLLCCCAGAAALLIAWRGKLAGMLVGGVVLGGGLAVLTSMLLLVPRYWWLSVPPICLGVQTLRMWRRPPEQGGMSVTLRTAGLLVLGIAMVLAGYSQVRRQVARERQPVARLKELDADVITAFDGVAKIVLLRDVAEDRIRLAGPLLAQLSGLRGVALDGSDFNSEALNFLPSLPRLEQLGLQNCPSVDDDAIGYIAQLTKLKELDLIRTAVGDANLQDLRTLKRVERLYLNGSKVTPAAVQRLRAKLPDAEISY
jgi:hypothetical protein